MAIANPLNAHFYGGVLGNIPVADGFELASDPQMAIAQYGNDPLQRAIEQMVVMPGGNRPSRRGWDAHVGRKFRHLNRAHRAADYAKGMPAVANGQLDSAADRLSGNALSMEEQGAGSDCEATKLTSLPPTKLNTSSKIIQVACGLHHSVLLTDSGDVYTFGSNQQGQLGLGDFAHREKPIKVAVHSHIVQVAAGSNHTVLLSNTGQVFTFGSNQKGQLGRLPSAIDYNWNASPYAVANIGPQNGRRATWVDASGDYTFVKLDESLINPLTLHSAKVVANGRCIVIAPPSDTMSVAASARMDNSRLDDRPFRSLVINRDEGSCRTFTGIDQINLASFSSMCLDSLYDVLWTYDAEAQIISRYNLINAEAKSLTLNSSDNNFVRLPIILSPEVALPNRSSSTVSRSNAAFNVLCSLHTLTTANQLG